MGRFRVWAKICVGKQKNKHSNQAQLDGEFMRQKWLIYGLTDSDPSALTILTLTFATGYTDRFGRSGDVDSRLTMGVEDTAWKITGICDILSEGCFAVSWG